MAGRLPWWKLPVMGGNREREESFSDKNAAVLLLVTETLLIFDDPA